VKEVHTWSVRLDVRPEAWARLYATLSQDERDRSARFRFARDRLRFVAARGTLRALLGRYLRTRPGRIRFSYNAFGKPELSPAFGSRLRFNLSHSAGLALIAITRDAAIGVDVEYIQPHPDYAEIARSTFSAAELDELDRVPSELYDEAFLRRWTRKEALVKARGEGLAGPGLDDTSSHAVSFQPAAGYIAAVAVEGRAE